MAVKVFCGPCQKKVCPLDHRCMTRVTPAMVYATAQGLLAPKANFNRFVIWSRLFHRSTSSIESPP